MIYPHLAGDAVLAILALGAFGLCAIMTVALGRLARVEQAIFRAKMNAASDAHYRLVWLGVEQRARFLNTRIQEIAKAAAERGHSPATIAALSTACSKHFDDLLAQIRCFGAHVHEDT